MCRWSLSDAITQAAPVLTAADSSLEIKRGKGDVIPSSSNALPLLADACAHRCSQHLHEHGACLYGPDKVLSGSPLPATRWRHLTPASGGSLPR